MRIIWILTSFLILSACAPVSPETQISRLKSSLSSDCDLDGLFIHDEAQKALSYFCGKNVTVESGIQSKQYVYVDEREGTVDRETNIVLTEFNISDTDGQMIVYILFKKTISSWKVDYLSDFFVLDYTGVPNPDFPYRYRLTENSFLFDSSNNDKLAGNLIEFRRQEKVICQSRIKDMSNSESSALSADCDLSRFKDGKNYAFDLILRVDDEKEYKGIIYARVD